MASNSPIPLTQGAFLRWRKQYPAAADDLIKMVNRLYSLETRLVSQSSGHALTQGHSSVGLEGDSLVQYLPFKGTAISDPLANTASNNAAILAILAYLRSTGFIAQA